MNKVWNCLPRTLCNFRYCNISTFIYIVLMVSDFRRRLALNYEPCMMKWQQSIFSGSFGAIDEDSRMLLNIIDDQIRMILLMMK